MAPSRGFSSFSAWRALACAPGRLHMSHRACSALHTPRLPWATLSSQPQVAAHPNTKTARRSIARYAVRQAVKQISDPANKLQSYLSSSDDPYFNLAFEDYLLEKSPPKSTILFLYVNRPCVVIGRNQNPWTEVNLGNLDAARSTRQTAATEPPAIGIGPVDLVRRRSGGGTVFHDEGNLNWSIISDRSTFTRDLHAEMTVRALRKLGVERARVNKRHDIVLDQGHQQRPSDPKDTHRTPYTVNDDDDSLPRPLKVSGSAYKLKRERALHHATTLLCSPNLPIIPQYLRSPAKDFIKAQGVESVSSPVGNIGLGVLPFAEHMQNEFATMYAITGPPTVVEEVDEGWLQVQAIHKNYKLFRSEDWIWSQTPRFDLQLDSSSDVGISMRVHYGIVKHMTLENDSISKWTQEALQKLIVGRELRDIGNWETFLREGLEQWDEPTETLAKRLDEILPIPKLSRDT